MKQRGPLSGNGPSSSAVQGAQPAQQDESTYEDRLSVGRRIAGGIKQPSYMPAAATGQRISAAKLLDSGQVDAPDPAISAIPMRPTLGHSR
jgi:hypothetical protein